jgi:hypothetical protein
MDTPIRERLERALRRLHLLHDDEGPATAEAARGATAAIEAALAEDSHHGLRERLSGYLVALETSHPAAAARVRELVDDLAEMGL